MLTDYSTLKRKLDNQAPFDVEVSPAMMVQDVVRLNLGCNRNALEGWTNVDLHRFKGVDVVTNLDARWPWEDGTVDYIRAYDLVEHLRSNIHTMNEAWRVLRVGGTFEILVPSTDGRGAFQDPTHISWWNINTFYYFAVSQEDGHYRSHPFRRIYAPHLIKAAFEIHLDESGPTEDGVIYIGAKCIKVPDPGDCEAPDGCDEPESELRDKG